MNNLRAMIQDELKQALAGLILLPAVEMTLVYDIVQPSPTILPAVIAPAPAVVASPIAPIIAGDPLNGNARGQSMNAALNTSNVEDVGNNMIKTAKKESLEQVQEQESKQMKALTQKMSKMKELMGGQSMGYSFDFTDILCAGENKLLDNFEVPQLPKFNGTRDPIIHISQ